MSQAAKIKMPRKAKDGLGKPQPSRQQRTKKPRPLKQQKLSQEQQPDTYHIPYGDTLENPKPQDVIRIISQNVNGLTPRNEHTKLTTLLLNATLLNTDLLLVQEHSLDTTQPAVRNEVHASIRSKFKPNPCIHLGSSQITTTSPYKPGGTGIISFTLNTRMEPQGRTHDSMGRWSSITLRRPRHKLITVISAYQSCPKPTNVIGTTFHHQQKLMLDAAKRKQTPRQAFMADLTTYVKALLSDGHEVILGGDFNETVTQPSSALLQFLMTTGMTDIWSQQHPNHPEFGTHCKGSNVIDFFFVSSGITPMVRGIGYLPIQSVMDSDHRPIFLDLDRAQLFGHSNQPTPTALQRTVRSKDKKSVVKFVTAVYKHLKCNNGFSRARGLMETDATEAQVEAVDQLITDAFAFGMKSAKTRQPEWFSHPLAQQRVIVSLLQSHLNNIKKKRAHRSAGLRYRTKTLELNLHFPDTLEETRSALTAATSTLHTLVSQHTNLRQAELESRVQNAADLDQTQLKAAIQNIKNHEVRMETYQILKSMKNQTSSATGLTRILVPHDWPSAQDLKSDPLIQLTDPKLYSNTPQHWRLVTDANEINTYLQIRNQRHFGQAHGTAMTLPAATSAFDWAASTTSAQQTLDGNPPKMDGFLGPMLRACSQSIEQQSLEVTMDQFRGKITRWPELTTTSPSGRHLGCYKALFTRVAEDSVGETENSNNDLDEKNTITFADKQEAIATCVLNVINACLARGYSLSRWRKVVNTMLCKTPGDVRIHRLRVIHIYEADLNMIFAIKWREAVHCALHKQVLDPGQFGGRPGCDCTALSMLEELKYEIADLTRRPLLNFDNDASSCYDRIIPALASLIDRKFGIHPMVVQLHAHMLKNAEFFLKTDIGVSATSYTHSPVAPIYGTGQGSANSPAIWLFISSVLFQIQALVSEGFQFVSADGELSSQFTMVGFVDDATGGMYHFEPQSILTDDDIIARGQTLAQNWSDILRTSGGALEPTKCSYHFLSYAFAANGSPILRTKPATQSGIQLQESTGQPIHVTALSPTTAHKTLGHFKAPADRQRTQFQRLREKAKDLAVLIARSPITRFGATVAYHTVFRKAVAWPLPQSYLSHTQTSTIDQQSMEVLFAKSGYHRKSPRGILYSPSEVGGAGFVRLKHSQGVGQILQFLKLWRSESLVSTALRIAVSWLQFQAGLSDSVFHNVSTPLSYVGKERWLLSLRRYLCEEGFSIRLDTTFVPSPSRNNDTPIMELAISSGVIPETSLKYVNFCRLYLGAYFLSDLCDASGQKVSVHSFWCERPPWWDTTKPVVHQRRPSLFQIKNVWQKFLRALMDEPPHLEDRYRLGPWTRHPSTPNRHQTYASLADRSLVQWNDTSQAYEEYRCHHGTTLFLPTGKFRPLSATDQPCVITQHQSPRGVQLLAPVPAFPIHRTITPTSWFYEDTIQSYSDWERDLLRQTSLEVDAYQYCTDRCPLLLVSDGSARDDGTMSFGWILSTTAGCRLARGYGQAYGEPTSFRAEAYGMLSAAVFITSFWSFLRVDTPNPLTVICDNEALIKRAKARQQYHVVFANTTLQADWDVTEQVHATYRDAIGTPPTFRWIRGHQDVKVQYRNLPLDAQLNVDADTLTKAAITSINQTPHFLPAGRALLIAPFFPITANYEQDLLVRAGLGEFRTLLRTKMQLPTNVINDLDVTTLSMTIRRCRRPHPQKVKLVYDLLPTKYRKSKFSATTPECSHCQHDSETMQHLLECQNPISNAFRVALLTAMTKLLAAQNVAPAIRQLLLDVATNPGTPPPRPSKSDHQLVHTIWRAQNAIGWPLFHRGFISLSWSRGLQALAPPSGKPPHNNLMSRVLDLMWTEIFAFWDTHLHHIHQSESPQVGSAAHRADLEATTRILFQHRPQLSVKDQNLLFPEDLDEFVTNSSTKRLENYISIYGPLIRTGVRDARRRIQSTHATLTSYGFTAQPTNRLARLQHTSGQLGAQHPHKHTRWRP